MLATKLKINNMGKRVKSMGNTKWEWIKVNPIFQVDHQNIKLMMIQLIWTVLILQLLLIQLKTKVFMVVNKTNIRSSWSEWSKKTWIIINRNTTIRFSKKAWIVPVMVSRAVMLRYNSLNRNIKLWEEKDLEVPELTRMVILNTVTIEAWA